MPEFYDIQFIQATEPQWMVSHYVPIRGEPCYAWDTKHFKIGDGVHTWATLPGPYMTLEDVIAYLEETGGPGADARIGEMINLTTEDKSTVVGAINEINGDGIDYSSLYANAKAG